MSCLQRFDDTDSLTVEAEFTCETIRNIISMYCNRQRQSEEILYTCAEVSFNTNVSFDLSSFHSFNYLFRGIQLQRNIQVDFFQEILPNAQNQDVFP